MKNLATHCITAGIWSILVLSVPGYGQNSLPLLKDVTASATNCNNQIRIKYSLNDADDEKINIAVQVIHTSGKSYQVAAPDAKGDVGYPVRPGKHKKIIWTLPAGDTDLQNWTVKVTADDLFAVDVQRLVDQVDSNRLLQDLQNLVGDRNFKSESGKQHLEKVRRMIEGQFTASGLLLSKQDTLYKDMRGQNIIGRKAGQAEEKKILVIGAHYDTVEGSPGADDNGSGVAGILEATRILSQYNFSKSIVFLGFDMEEYGHIGSQAYVSNAGGISPAEQVEGCINFDMIGYYSNKPNSQLLPQGFDVLFPEGYQQAMQDSLRGNFALNVSNSASGTLAGTFSTCAGKYVPGLKLISLQVPGNGQMVPDLRRSDHASFWDKGYQAIYIGDGANTRNFNYHSPKDTLQTVNLTQVANVVKATVACIAELAGLQHSSSASSRIQHKECPASISAIPAPK